LPTSQQSRHDRDEEKRRRRRERGVVKKKPQTGRALIALFVFIAVVAIIYVVATAPAPPPPGPVTVTDFTLPEVSASGLTGRQVSLSQFYGKVIVLQFMVPWCPHCQNMAPILRQLYSQYGPDGVVFITVSGSWSGATAGDAANFIKQYGSQWTYLYDSSGTAFNQYGVTSTPTLFIISKSKTIANTLGGEVSYAELAADLDAAIKLQ
jgi:thiol-disulfide isomerase/thioredoxin